MYFIFYIVILPQDISLGLYGKDIYGISLHMNYNFHEFIFDDN